MTLLEKARKLDSEDSLASYRSQFHLPEKNGTSCIYLCGNSLGLLPKGTQAFIANELNKWSEKGVEGHFTGKMPWVNYHQNSKDSLSRLIGSQPHEVVAMNNLTTNLHLAMMTFYQPVGKRNRIIIERGAFPSDFYAVHSQIESRGLDPEECLIELSAANDGIYLSTDQIIDQIKEEGDQLALVLLPGVQYYSGQFFDIKKITQATHEAGANVGFDLAHAVGNVPLTLHDDQVDFAVWCSYKYLNSGPGGVGGLFIHENHARNTSLKRLSGWWGHDAVSRFQMNNEINPIPSVDGWQLSNVNVLSHSAHLASLSIFDQAGIQNLRVKSILLTNLLEEGLIASEILRDKIKIITPSNPDERGCQLSLFLLNHGKEIYDFLLERGVILDWREPNVIRVAPVPLYNTFEEVIEFVSILDEAISNEK